MEGILVVVALAVLTVPVLLIVVLVTVSGLKARVTDLEQGLAAVRAAHSVDAATAAPAAPAVRVSDLSSPRRDVELAARVASPLASPDGVGVDRAAGPPVAVPSGERAAPASARPVPPPGSDPLSRFVRWVRRWFTEGNVPVKVGMLVLFAGVAALLKYASDQGLMHLPLELRLAGVAVAALAGLVFGWQQRVRKRGFALSLQGGAIGVLLLVVFAASRLYAFLPLTAALVLSVALVAGAGVLAVRQDAVALAVLGILAGFLAPLWLSTGQGSHVVLFGYYALLNAAILCVALVRPWRILNLLGFVFTFAIGTFWGVLKYRADDFATTEPFLLLFFAFYLLIPILYARLRAATRPDRVEGCLVFGLPLVAFALQAALLEGARMPLAMGALGASAIYVALASTLWRRPRYAALVAPYAILAVGFATLAVPLALSAHATASVFALEGAALVWLGLRQDRRLQLASGVLLQLVAAWAYVIGAETLAVASVAIANPAFMGALLIAVAGFASAWSLRDASRAPTATVFYLWGLAWWLGAGGLEIQRFIVDQLQPDWLFGMSLLTGWLAAEVYRRRPARALAWTAVAALALAVPLVFVQVRAHDWPLGGLGSWAWLAYAAAGWRMLQVLRGTGLRQVSLAHACWLLAWALMTNACIAHLIAGRLSGDGWQTMLVALPWLLVAAGLQWQPRRLELLLAGGLEKSRSTLQMLFAGLLAAGWLWALLSPGSSAPLPWVAVVNPLDLAQLLVLAVLAAWLATPVAPAALRAFRSEWLAGASFVLLSVITLRAAHHWGAVAWDSTMFSTSLVQMSLTVVWSVLGVLGWIIGSRRGHRDLWRVGAVLMAVVLVKLVLVDRQHLGSGFGIASFIAYGLLCTAVGYFAPAPARPEGFDGAQPQEQSA